MGSHRTIGTKMGERSQDMQNHPVTKLRNLLKYKKVRTRKLSELSKTEQNRLAKLNAMLDELRRVENVTNFVSTYAKTVMFVSDFKM